MTQPNNARLEALKKSWQQKKEINDKLDKITFKIGVYSGKGGVGKTTVAVNLAVSLANKDKRVGILDTDVDCPNVPKIIGVHQDAIYQNGTITPGQAFGVKVVSMGFFQENEEEAIIWRGPMIHNAINQFLQATEWGELDILVVDLPPGTSHAPLSVMQNLKLDGFVVVTTPHDLAKLDAKRSINMIRKMNVDVLGVVENFSGGQFGSGGGESLAEEMSVPFLGCITLRDDYQMMDSPTIIKNKEANEEYVIIADQVLGSLLNK
jgi:ATP-binding protein involved in chromosome partitioning